MNTVFNSGAVAHATAMERATFIGSPGLAPLVFRDAASEVDMPDTTRLVPRRIQVFTAVLSALIAVGGAHVGAEAAAQGIAGSCSLAEPDGDGTRAAPVPAALEAEPEPAPVGRL